MAQHNFILAYILDLILSLFTPLMMPPSMLFPSPIPILISYALVTLARPIPLSLIFLVKTSTRYTCEHSISLTSVSVLYNRKDLWCWCWWRFEMVLTLVYFSSKWVLSSLCVTAQSYKHLGL